jgi:hypothetical protein
MTYFVSDASKVINGMTHHDLGTSRIYTSHDSGKTWKLGITTGWMDYSTSVVDTTPGPNQNRLYIFFNALDSFYLSLGELGAAKAEQQETGGGTRVGMISYKDGDAQVAGPFSSYEMLGEKNQGSFPAPALLLKDGTMVVLYTAKHKDAKGDVQFTVEAVRSSPNRTSLEAPVTIVDSLDGRNGASDQNCVTGYAFDPGVAYDSVRDRLYFVYSDARGKMCHLFVTTSSDGGKSWSRTNQILSADESSAGGYIDPAVAVNREGILGVMWEQRPRSGCWMFAVSTNGGTSLSRAKQLGTCSGMEFKPSALSTDDLLTSIFQAGALPKLPKALITITLRNTRNSVSRNENAIAITLDGAFHPVWIEAGNGQGEIRTAAIHVTSEDTLIASATRGLDDITTKVAILYGGNQFYDPNTKTLTLDIVVKNESLTPIAGPFKLVVPSLQYDYGYAEIANAANGVTGAGAVWDISSSIMGEKLDPGSESLPFSLQFHYLLAGSEERPNDAILGLSVKLFARGQSTPESHR